MGLLRRIRWKTIEWMHSWRFLLVTCTGACLSMSKPCTNHHSYLSKIISSEIRLSWTNYRHILTDTTPYHRLIEKMLATYMPPNWYPNIPCLVLRSFKYFVLSVDSTRPVRPFPLGRCEYFRFSLSWCTLHCGAIITGYLSSDRPNNSASSDMPLTCSCSFQVRRTTGHNYKWRWARSLAFDEA
jgi:hypothetical protein